MYRDITVAVGGPVNADYPKVYKTKFLKPGIPFGLQVTEQNTKYVIKHNFDLGGEEVTIPEGCILEFDGGSLDNGTLVGNNTCIDADKVKIFGDDLNLSGNFNVKESYPEWFGVVPDDNTIDATPAIKKLVYAGMPVQFSDGTYYLSECLINGIKDVSLKGTGTHYKEGTNFKAFNATGQKFILKLGGREDFENPREHGQEYHDIWCSNFILTGIRFNTYGTSFVNADGTGVAQNYAACCFDFAVDGCVDIKTGGACPGVFIANTWEVYFETITLYGSYTKFNESALYFGKAYTDLSASNISAITIDNLFAETIHGKIVDSHNSAGISPVIINNIEFEPREQNASHSASAAYDIIRQNIRSLGVQYLFNFSGGYVLIRSISYTGQAATFENDTIARGLIRATTYGSHVIVEKVVNVSYDSVINIYGAAGYGRLDIGKIECDTHSGNVRIYTDTGAISDFSNVYNAPSPLTGTVNIDHTMAIVDEDLIKTYNPGLLFNRDNVAEVSSLKLTDNRSVQLVGNINGLFIPFAYFRATTLDRKFKFNENSILVFNYTAPNMWDTENIIITYYKDGEVVNIDNIKLEYSDTKLLSYEYNVYTNDYDYCTIRFKSSICIESVIVKDIVSGGTTSNIYDESLGKNQDVINQEVSQSISNLNNNKANKATTLSGYGIIDTYTKNETDTAVAEAVAGITGGSAKTIKNVDDYVNTVNGKIDTLKGDSDTTIPAINAAIASEVSRATIAEELLQEQYNALTQSDKIIGPLPTSGHKDVIYRVPGTNSYSDYMYAHEGDTTPVLMATYNNAIDGVPTPESTNIASSGGTAKKISETTRKVWLRNGSSGNVDNTSVVCSSFIPTNGKHRFKIVITRPNVPGYRYRVGYCLTDSVNDLYKTLDMFHLDGYIYHADTFLDTSLCADHIINFGYNNRPVGVSCQIDEVSIADSTVVNPLRVTDFNGYTVSIVDYDDDELYVYAGAGTDGLVVEEVLVNVESKSVYIHNGTLIMRSKNNAFGRTFLDNTAFAAELGVSLVTSPTGVQNCIELPSAHCIVLDKAAGKYKIKERYEVSDDDVVIMGCSDGKLVYLINGLATSVLYKHNHDTDERLDVAESDITALKTINSFTSIFRNGSVGNPANTKVVTSAFINCAKGSVKINVTRPNTNGYRYLYGYALSSSIEDIGTTRDISQMVGYLSHADSDIESPSCDKDTIDILSNACVGIAIQIREVLIEDYEAYKRGDILAEDVRYNNPFYISEFKNSFISLEKVNEDDVEVDLTKAEEFNLLFKNAYGDVEPFIFFSDPHYCQTYDDASFIPSAKQNINNILSHYKNTATNFVLCGGDWLTDHKQSIAVKTLAKIDGLMNKTFDKYYPVFGNHDNNYQGELDTTDDRSVNDGGLTNQQMVNLWFRKYGKMYYSFNGTSTKFYVFDTGIDWVTEMNDYRWEQVDWFANQLLNNNDSNIVIVMHIISNSGQNFANITPMSTNITAVAQAFNNRTSITMNGHTYNFSGKTGKVRCAVCGHTHYDYITTLNSIPVYCITTAMDGTFDMVLLDYGANKLRTVRVGSGSNREMNII